MSRIAKKPIVIPDGIEVKCDSALNSLLVKGKKGSLQLKLHPKVTAELKDKAVQLQVADPEDVEQRALWGTMGSLFKNMLKGVSEGFEKKLEIHGIGFKATLESNRLVLLVGYTHPVIFPVPTGITVTMEKNILSISGIDKQLVGETAAQIRAIKKPEVYKGKGIRYAGEVVRLKPGKAGKAGAAA